MLSLILRETFFGVWELIIISLKKKYSSRSPFPLNRYKQFTTQFKIAAGHGTLLRDMMDLDCWIVSTGAGQATGLPDSRDAFWRVVHEEGMGGRRVYTSSAPLSLPGEIKNPRIRPFMSGAYAGTIPAEILPLEPEVERALVGTLLQELQVLRQFGSKPLA
jgi:hypothetical protein